MITKQEQEILVSEVAEIQENFEVDELEDYVKIKEIVEGLNICEAERLREQGCINECFFDNTGNLTENYTYHIKEKKKYYYLDVGGSGKFMICKESGNIFGIKSYGSPNKNKCFGNFKTISGADLHQKRFA